MAYQTPGKRTGQGHRRALGLHVLLTVFANRESGDRAGRVKENIVRAVIPGRTQPCREIVFWCKREINFEESGVAQQTRSEFTPHGIQLIGGRENQSLIGFLVVAMAQWFGSFLRYEPGGAVEKTDERWHVKDVLIESGEEECTVSFQRPTQSESKLLLLIVRFYVNERVTRIERAVTHKVESGSMQIIGSALGNYVYD